jgi:hypothetical protein
MRLNQTIKVRRHPVTAMNVNKVITPPPMELVNPEVTFMDMKAQKLIVARLEKFPAAVILYNQQDYDKVVNKSDEAFYERLLQILGDNPGELLHALLPRTLEADPNGPGTILHGMFSSLGIKSDSTCGCMQRALEMNRHGPEWCSENINLILGWLKKEAEKRKLPFIEPVARLIVNKAISKSKRLLAKAKV